MSQNSRIQLNFHEIQPGLAQFQTSNWLYIEHGPFKVCCFLKPEQLQQLAADLVAIYGLPRAKVEVPTGPVDLPAPSASATPTPSPDEESL